MGALIFYILFLLMPISVTLFFIVSLILFINAKSKNKKIPETFSSDQIKTRKALLIISSVLMGALLLVIIGLYVLLMTAVAFM